MLQSLNAHAFLERLADKEPPGSGSAAAFTGAVGVSLLEMGVRIGGAPPTNDAAAIHLGEIRSRLEALVERDAAVLREALPMLAAIGPDGSSLEWNAVLEKAAQVPIAIAERCADALEIAQSLRDHSPFHLICDIKCAAMQCNAGLQGALLLAELNVSLLRGDDALAKTLHSKTEALLERAEVLLDRILR